MTELAPTIVDYETIHAERVERVRLETEFLKDALIPLLRAAGIARIEVHFDGCGDSGAVEARDCFDTAGTLVDCPPSAIAPFEFEIVRQPPGDAPMLVVDALDELTYLALENHHSGWEVNDGSCGTLIIDVAAASFVLECSLRYTACHDHSTEL